MRACISSSSAKRYGRLLNISMEGRSHFRPRKPHEAPKADGKAKEQTAVDKVHHCQNRARRGKSMHPQPHHLNCGEDHQETNSCENGTHDHGGGTCGALLKTLLELRP